MHSNDLVWVRQAFRPGPAILAGFVTLFPDSPALLFLGPTGTTVTRKSRQAQQPAGSKGLGAKTACPKGAAVEAKRNTVSGCVAFGRCKSKSRSWKPGAQFLSFFFSGLQRLWVHRMAQKASFLQAMRQPKKLWLDGTDWTACLPQWEKVPQLGALLNPFFGWEGSPTKIDHRQKLVPLF